MIFSKSSQDTFDNAVNIITITIILIILVFSLFTSIFNSPLFRAKAYANVINIEESVFAEDIPTTMDTDVMDIETAQNIGSRVMGEIDDVSQYVISQEYNMIIYQGKTYRVSPLEYASSLKAWGNKGIEGYVLVDCNTQEARLIKTAEKIKYAPSAIFSYDLMRHVRNSYPSELLGKYHFEIDEEGTPYYIMPTYRTTIGLFNGEVLDKVLVVNAITGQINEYGLDDIPQWIEHVDSISHLAELATNHYLYTDGFFNSITSQKNVKNLSYNYASEDFKGYSSIKTNNGIEFFTGVTSVNNDESILGFLFLNPRTGKITFYNCVGAEESSAMSSAEALVQNYGYEASYPFIVNENGKETYLIALKDKTGTNKAYSLVNVRNYTIATQASTKEAAIKQYNNLMNSNTSNSTDNTNLTNNVITGKITKIYTVIENSNTFYYYMLEGYEELFVSSILNNRNQVKLNIGDTITVNVEYIDNYYVVNNIQF